MGNRYGRNQRRQAREALAAAAAENERLTQQRDGLRDSVNQLHEDLAVLSADVDHIVTTLIELLGDAHVAVPLRYTRELQASGRIDRWPVRTRGVPVFREAPAVPEKAVISVVHLLRLAAEVAQDPDRLGVYIRFRDKNDNGLFPGAGIYVSLEEYRRKGFTPEFVDYLMRDVRNRFVRYLGAPRHVD